MPKVNGVYVIFVAPFLCDDLKEMTVNLSYPILEKNCTYNLNLGHKLGEQEK